MALLFDACRRIFFKQGMSDDYESAYTVLKQWKHKYVLLPILFFFSILINQIL